MSMSSAPVTCFEARVVHKKSNALKITFHEGPGAPIAEGVQGAGDGKGKKLSTLFGFKNGGTGKHQLTYADGRVLGVQSLDGAPSVFTQSNETPLATVTRGEDHGCRRRLGATGRDPSSRRVGHPAEPPLRGRQ
jgi:hypothetical protein